MSKVKTILLLEDDAAFGEQVQETLRAEGFHVIWAKRIAAARKALQDEFFSMALLDVNLPEESGFDLCREIREMGDSMPIIFLTARLDEDSAVKGLTLGATDYLRKPFSGKELVFRIRRVLGERSTPLSVGNVHLDPAGRQVWVDKTAVKLSPSEFDILYLLAKTPGDVVSREKILDMLDEDGEISERTIQSYCSRLKKKLEQNGNPGLKIVSVYGQGYRLDLGTKKKAA